ncbi:MAG: DUF1616 domain-containing protein [Candidatus Heimdallarchaeota archaeon]|nr:DUF1616 domain-containing protein [Candidatus Heimdallarchaeota archaeon]
MKNKIEKQSKSQKFDFELAVRMVLILTLIGIVISTILVFTPPISGDQYTELGLLTYNDDNNKYEAFNYPTSVVYNQTTNTSDSITLYTKLVNHYQRAMFYEIRLKIGLNSLFIDEDTFGSNTSTYFYNEHWIQKIINLEEQWGPSFDTKFTFIFTSEIIDKLGVSSSGYKIIFELWEWSSQMSEFRYSGVFVYLNSFMLILT